LNEQSGGNRQHDIHAFVALLARGSDAHRTQQSEEEMQDLAADSAVFGV
jgi:hypothetical protein